MDTQDILIEFFDIIDSIYSMYHDSIHGFHLNIEQIERIQTKASQEFNLPIDHLDNLSFQIGVGDPNNPDSYVLLECKQKEFKQRNTKDGINSTFLGNLVITELYHYWEEYYRELISNSLGFEKNKLKSDVFGDLRHFRNSIIHNRSIATDDVEKCKVFTWFKRGEPIKFSQKQIEKVIEKVKMEPFNEES